MSRPKNSLPTVSWTDSDASVISNAGALREILAHSGTVSEINSNPLLDLQPVQPLHRIAVVRKEQGVSLFHAAKKLETGIAETRRQETETTDLLLSQLYRWREILDVSMGELVIEPEEIPNNPIRNRSRLVKIMKTVRAIMEVTREERTQILAQILFDQMVELMPELKSISAWPNIGQSREQRDFGQAAYRRFDAVVSQKIDIE